MGINHMLTRIGLLAAFVCLPLVTLASNTMTNDVKPLQQEVREPEGETGFTIKKAVHGKHFMVAAANPYASQAGFTILKKGGSAVDAAIAVQLVLTLVEPQSSGIGGGGFLLHWHQKHKQLTTFDGREIAPQAATSELFLDKHGKAVKWIDAVVGGKSVGVPGLLAALNTAHKKFGQLPWKELFEPAIALAEQGFVVSPRLEKLLTMGFNPGIYQLPEINNYFFPNGQLVKAGDTLKNPKLAKVLSSIASHGIDVFYQGWLAEKIVEKVQHAAISPGFLTMADMSAYKVKERLAVCGKYHQYNICGMAPPSSGGISVIQILAQLQAFELSKFQPNSLQAIHLLTQSSRLAFADRSKYIADSDFVPVPVTSLLSPDYLEQRGRLIDPKQDMGKATAGQLNNALALADDNAIERPSTTHISIVDRQGNAISMTSSIENGFGSALMVEGFILNNQLTDFSLAPVINGKLVANRVQPLKRPRSSMAPMMIFNQDDSLKLVIGSPGGSRIINYVAQTIIGVLDWKLDVQSAINLPHVTNRNYVTTLERGTHLVKFKSALEAQGHLVKIKPLNSGIHAIEVTTKGLIGGADPRREGQVFAQ